LLWSTSLSTNHANFDLQAGTVTGGTYTAATITAAANGFYRITITSTLAAASGGSFLWLMDSGTAPRGGNYTGNGTSGTYIWGAQLETGSTATAYQRVTTQYDVTEAGVQSLSYLSFDGVDDFLVTPTITPGIDKAQVFAGVRKLANGGQTVMEFSVNSGLSTGSFGVFVDGSAGGATTTPNYSYALSGTTSGVKNAVGYGAPITNVIAFTSDIAGLTPASEITLRVNGATPSTQESTTTNSGTGNFLAYPLYIGRRGGTTFPFNGQIYSLIVRFGANLTATQITSTEIYVGDKTGINIANNISTTIFARDNTAVLDRFNQTIERRA
jgi:hypothetical protein